MRTGILVGATSAFFVAIFSSLNKRFIGNSSALTVTGVEMAAGAIFLTIVGLSFPLDSSLFILPSVHDAWLLAALAIGCTLFPFALSLVALRQISAFSASLAVNLEPIYAIVLAILLLGEQRELAPSFYLGVAIILVVVFLHPLWSGRKRVRVR